MSWDKIKRGVLGGTARAFLSDLYETALDNIGERYLRASQLVGPVGTGKTSAAIRFGEILEETASEWKIKLKHVYLNGKMEGEPLNPL